MKKIVLAMLICIASVASFAQSPNGGISNVNDSTCFCCGDFYKLPKPVINGPQIVNCGDRPTYCIPKCPKASISWSVSPTIGFVASATGECIRLNAPIAPGNYVITVTLTCANKKISNSLKVRVNGVTNCSPLFNTSLTLLPNGLWRIDANPTTTTSGVQHYWGLLGNPTPATCTHIPLADIIEGRTFGGSVSPTGVFTPLGMGTGKNASTSGYGFQYSGIANVAGCYKITHYVNCCGVWYRQTICFCITVAGPGTAAKLQKPEIIKSDVEKVENKDLPKALQAVNN